jgi:hypothetical protein
MPKKKTAKKKSGKAKSASRTKAMRSKKSIQRKKVTRTKRPRSSHKDSKLTQAAVTIGSMLGKADSAAHKAAAVVKEGATAISDQVKDALS